MNIIKKILGTILICALFCIVCVVFTSVKSQAASQKNWQSVCVDEMSGDGFESFIKYGKLSIARNRTEMHIKSNSDDTSIEIKTSYSIYGRALTNGKDIIYQYGKNVYLWKNAKSTTKLFSLEKKSDILIARYGNNIFYGRNIDYDAYQMYRYNLKTKKTTKTEYHNAYYSNGKYMFIGGQFHEGVSTPLYLYNMKTGKVITIAKKASYGNAAIIRGNCIYYIELNDKEIMNYRFKIVQYNLKTKKKTVLKKGLATKPQLLDKNHYFSYGEDGTSVYVYDLRTGEEIAVYSLEE